MKRYAIFIASILALAGTATARDWPQAVSYRPGTVPGSTVGLDATGRVAQIILPDGKTILVDHSPDGRVTAQQASNGNTVEISTTYRDGTGTNDCNDHPTAAAVTKPGSYTVLLCGTNFTSLSQSGAAIIVIHEGLHSAGMTENPPDPSAKTSDQINAMVIANCGLNW